MTIALKIIEHPSEKMGVSVWELVMLRQTQHDKGRESVIDPETCFDQDAKDLAGKLSMTR